MWSAISCSSGRPAGERPGTRRRLGRTVPPSAPADKPTLIAATGGTGRHSLVLEHALRPVFAYLH
ncbi:hypothetical protein ABZS63_14285, partial [Streptomyces sp. NPDC005568]